MAKIRTVKIEIKPSSEQKRVLNSALWNCRRLYNLLVEQLQIIRNKIKELRAESELAKPWEDDYLNILRPGWASEFLRTVEGPKGCTYPKTTVTRKRKSGKNKGEEYQVEEIVTPDGKKNSPPGSSGIPGQSLGLIAKTFEANIKSCFKHWRNGNHDANLPKRFKSSFPLPISNQQIKYLGKHIYQFGAGDTTISLRLPQLSQCEKIADAKFSRSRSGKYYLFVCWQPTIKVNSELTNVAAVDFGQKRAVVISAQLKDGSIKTALISGKNILALKRERDRRNREINRQRSRIFKGHLRQYLSDEEKETYRKLQEQDNQRQASGKKRTGGDMKYAHRIINQRRRDGLDGKGRNLYDIGQASHNGICLVAYPGLKIGVLRKFSTKDYRLKQTLAKVSEYYRVRLDYANHCVSRSTVDWAIAHKVGEIYVGDLKSLPKGRKKGNRRIKQVSRNNRWEMPTQKKYIEEKLILAGSPLEEPVKIHHERYTSQTCPRCQQLTKSRNRVFRCKHCGWTGDRDGVGSTNFLSLVTTGSCGNLMPESTIRTLPVAPAIGQRNPMHREESKKQFLGSIDSAERLAPILTQSTGSIVQAPAKVECCEKDGLTEILAVQERRGKETGTRCMNNHETSVSREFPIPVGDSQTTKSGAKSKGRRRSVHKRTEAFIQLTLWGKGCDRPFGY